MQMGVTPMPKYLTIDPKQFMPSQWEELYNVCEIMPRSIEAYRHARPFKRQKYQIRTAIACCVGKIERVNELLCPKTESRLLNRQWVDDLKQLVEILSRLTGDMATCPKCGDSVPVAMAFEDTGTGEESGRTFYYCSNRCRRNH